VILIKRLEYQRVCAEAEPISALLRSSALPLEAPGGVIPADRSAPIEGKRYQPIGAAIKVCCTAVPLAHRAWHLPRLPASTAA
jgi:hypothetical protein